MDAQARLSPWDGHIVLLYRSEQERLSNLATWIQRGLECDEKILLAERHDALVSLSARGGPDVKAARRTGQLAVLPVASFYSARGQDDAARQAATEGFSGVRLTAPASSALTVMSAAEYLAVEQAMDLRCRTQAVSAMCQYTRAEASASLSDTLVVHVDGLRSSGFTTARGDHGLRLVGEVDLVNRDLLAAVIGAALGGPATDRATPVGAELVLDLSALEFLDVAGCRMLLEATAEQRRGGGRLVLLNPRPAAERVLRLLAVDGEPGVNLVQSTGPARGASGGLG